MLVDLFLMINGDIYLTQRCKEHVLQEWRKHLSCVWFTCSRLVMKAVKGNWQESVVTFCLWTFYYVKGKLLSLSHCFVMCYHWKTISFFPHMTSFIHRSRFMWKYIHSVDVCGWSHVSVTWLHSNSHYRADHPVVFPWPWLQSQPILCGLWSTNSLWPQRVAGISIVWVLRARVGKSDSQLWLSYFRPQLYYLLLSCFVELFNRCPQHPKDRDLRAKITGQLSFSLQKHKISK